MVPIDLECRFYPNHVSRMCINVNKLQNRQKKSNVETPSGPLRFHRLNFCALINPWNIHLNCVFVSCSSWNKHFFYLHLFWNDNKMRAIECRLVRTIAVFHRRKIRFSFYNELKVTLNCQNCIIVDGDHMYTVRMTPVFYFFFFFL